MSNKKNSRKDSLLVSMTGFGRSVQSDSCLTLELELKSVNARYLDISMRLPREYSIFESDLRKAISERVSRGRVEVNVARKLLPQEALQLQFNKSIFESYFSIYKAIFAEYGSGSKHDMSNVVRDLLARRDILEAAERSIDIEHEKPLLLVALQEALAGLVKMRQSEGAELAKDINKRLQELLALNLKIEQFAAKAPTSLRDKLLDRVMQLAPEVQLDPARLAGEVALLADRVDITEENVRLRAHCEALQLGLEAGFGGRKLEFLLQECVRELNTMGSKAQEAQVQALVVDGKSVVEKLREQVQNIE